MSEKPIYVQLMDSIKKKIQDGQLQVGDRLVSESTFKNAEINLKKGKQ